MKILSIETSCDDTGISVLDIKENLPRGKAGKNSPVFTVLSNVIASQVEMGKKYGGVFPAMAKREHQKNLVPVLVEALKEAGLLNTKSGQKVPNLKTILSHEPELKKKLIPFLKKYAKPEIDLISVTNGPGLEPCLWVGVNFAKALSSTWNIPVVPVNHIESHILVNFLDAPMHQSTGAKFPAVALVVSGGHTQLILMKKIGDYKILGETRDDAAGECFDKCAKILGLGYPGGPIISKLAEKSFPGKINLPRPMMNTKDYDFSFSGLKTAVLYYNQKQDKKTQKSKEYIADMASEIQQSVVDVLLKKTIQTAKDFKAKTIILGGGVSANHELKTQLIIKMHEELPGVEYLFPQINHSTDNGLMTAIAGYFHKKNTVALEKIQADGNLRIGE